MKFVMNIFVVFFVLMSAFANAAVASDGCDDDNNNRIVPTLAMCSTHVYNIGQGTNPSGSDKTFMRDVIALKTTVMTQQMNKQYEYLETMIKRLKTQLEKAVLTTSLQAKGAASDSGGGASSSSGVRPGGDPNIYIMGAKNCNNEATDKDVFNCLFSNWNLINSMSNYGQNIDVNLRKQLATDFSLLNRMVKCPSGKMLDVERIGVNCTEHARLTGKKNFSECLNSMRGHIRTAIGQNGRVNGLASFCEKLPEK